MKGVSLTINTIVILALAVLVLAVLSLMIARQPSKVEEAEMKSALPECCTMWANYNYNPSSIGSIKCGNYKFEDVIKAWNTDPTDVNEVKKLCQV